MRKGWCGAFHAAQEAHFAGATSVSAAAGSAASKNRVGNSRFILSLRDSMAFSIRRSHKKNCGPATAGRRRMWKQVTGNKAEILFRVVPGKACCDLRALTSDDNSALSILFLMGAAHGVERHFAESAAGF